MDRGTRVDFVAPALAGSCETQTPEDPCLSSIPISGSRIPRAMETSLRRQRKESKPDVYEDRARDEKTRIQSSNIMSGDELIENAVRKGVAQVNRRDCWGSVALIAFSEWSGKDGT